MCFTEQGQWVVYERVKGTAKWNLYSDNTFNGQFSSYDKMLYHIVEKGDLPTRVFYQRFNEASQEEL